MSGFVWGCHAVGMSVSVRGNQTYSEMNPPKELTLSHPVDHVPALP